ncbi:MAG: hypothetical protein ACR652_10855 [Methylocystis sp.]|uniref:hypothetical protein n=1 Tax=Methylocystis sp. TaxID=1911079 RepID=UPI003DA21E44
MDADLPLTDVPNGQPIDPRTLGLGLLNEVEMEYLSCAPIACVERAWSALWRLGVRGRAVNGRDHLDALACEPVVFLGGARFELSRYLPGNASTPAAIIPARDEFTEVVDLAAWGIERGEFALWRGAVPALGLENVARPQIDGPLIAHESVLSWLRAGREGVFIIDPSRAARWLDGITLGVLDHAFGRRLREELTIAPKIVAPSEKQRKAA